jgi:polysaccharide biosynthesis/export protein
MGVDDISKVRFVGLRQGGAEIGRFGSFLLLTAVLGLPATAQQQPPAAVVPPLPNQTDDTRYRIGPGDVLAIFVRKAPELSLEAVRVDQRGMISIPMIEEQVKAACRTESELATQVATLYSQYKRNPSVAVFVRDFQSRPVAVIGAVNAPGQFRLQRQIRLLELLSFAGGPSDKAGRVIDVIHTGGPDICQSNASDGTPPSFQGLGVFKLPETLKGKEGSNPFVQPGDIISLPEADQIYVVGDVYQPRAIALKDKPITVSKAIAMAGGPQRDSKVSRIRIVRQTNEGEQKQEIFVDLNAIEKRRAEDIVLLPNDIVAVPTSTGKILLNALTGAIAPALSQGTIRAIP